MRSLYEDADDVPEIDPIHDIKRAWQTIERHDKLIEKLGNAKKMFPFVSFLCPLDVMERKETLWAKTLSDIANCINVDVGDGHEAINVQLALPMCDDAILHWRKRLSTMTMDASQNFSDRMSDKMHAQREKVWLVSCEPVNGADITMCLMVALLNKVGSFPPMPTAMFPCDSSTTSTAISEMTWRLKQASHILDEGEKDDTALRLASIFLCSGMIVVTHPNTLRPQDQDILLAGLGAYF